MVAFDIEFLEAHGFSVSESLLDAGEVKKLIGLIEEGLEADPRRAGVRDVMTSIPALLEVATKPAVQEIVHLVLGPDAFLVRSTFFDKTPDANWKVPWHQDLTIAVRQRFETNGYGPWPRKSDVVHVQSPTKVLEKMLTVRVHLDACPIDNGALRVLPGTQRLGRVNQNFVANYVDESRAVTCPVNAGGALMMRPLLLHACSASSQPSHRRVLHFDFAACPLDNGLMWQLYG